MRHPVSAQKLGFVKVRRLVEIKQEHLDKGIDQHTIKSRAETQKLLEGRSQQGQGAA